MVFERDLMDFFGLPGTICPLCHLKVCKNCRIMQKSVQISSFPWICTMCSQKQQFGESDENSGKKVRKIRF